MKKIPISKFAANCQAIIDEAIASGQPVTITRSGKAIAEIVPAPARRQPPRQLGGMEGTLDPTDDLIDTSDLWDFEESIRDWDELNSAITKDVAAVTPKPRKKS
jgi:antitoxin (DNA-binding transcriptional repressor) of toxin-antitoxin stability system